MSFKDGALTLESNDGVLLVWNKIAENTKTLKFDAEANEYKPVEGAVAALNQVKAGTYMMVGDGRAYIRIGARKDRVTGTFVSFKNDRLLRWVRISRRVSSRDMGTPCNTTSSETTCPSTRASTAASTS